MSRFERACESCPYTAFSLFANYRPARNARDTGKCRAASRARRRAQPLRRTELPRRVGLEPPRVDRRKIRGTRRVWRSVARAHLPAIGAEVSPAQSLAHRALGAAGGVRLAPRVVTADSPD